MAAAALLTAGAVMADTRQELLQRGDNAWQRRAEGHRGEQAANGPIDEAVAAYETALARSPGDIGIRKRLLQALWFRGMFAATDEAARRETYAAGRDLADQGIARLAADLGRTEPFDLRSPEVTAAAAAERPESAALFFWAAAHWGLWAESSGVLAAARQGVAGRIRDYAQITALVDERFENGGGHRILGRLHTESPRIPFVTGWVKRDQAVASLERALSLAPRDPWNRLYLGDALLRFRPQRRDEARAILEALVAEPPRSDNLLQDLRVQREARELLTAAGRR